MNYMEMLARLGIGSAHPGGFTATLEQLQEHPIPPESRVLEVGCGTGRTACHLAAQGHRVTAVDIRRDMLAKAERRAAREGVQVDFREGNIQSLPFEEESFDVILAESVTIFADVRKSVAEYYRVLKPGGVLYDREILAMHTIKPQLAKELEDFYGMDKLLLAEEWIDLLRSSGFQGVQVWKPRAFPAQSWEDLVQYPDLLQQVDSGVYQDETIWKVARKYDEIMLRNLEYFGYAVVIGSKP
jgi:ubiquinone/menaquinone biosynthesis C-methylase UbiE